MGSSQLYMDVMESPSSTARNLGVILDDRLSCAPNITAADFPFYLKSLWQQALMILRWRLDICFYISFYSIDGDMSWFPSCGKFTYFKSLWKKAPAKCPKCKCECKWTKFNSTKQDCHLCGRKYFTVCQLSVATLIVLNYHNEVWHLSFWWVHSLFWLHQQKIWCYVKNFTLYIVPNIDIMHCEVSWLPCHWGAHLFDGNWTCLE